MKGRFAMQPFTASFRVGPYQVRLEVSDAADDSPAAAQPVLGVVGDTVRHRAPEDPTLTPNERRVLAAVKPIIQSAKQIAHEAGYERASGQLYATLRTLADKGYVERAPGGGFRRKPDVELPALQSAPHRPAAEQVSRSPSQAPASNYDNLLPSEREALRVLTPERKTATEIAHAIGHDRCSGQLYATLRSLLQMRLVEHVPGGGYRLAPGVEPPPEICKAPVKKMDRDVKPRTKKPAPPSAPTLPNLTVTENHLVRLLGDRELTETEIIQESGLRAELVKHFLRELSNGRGVLQVTDKPDGRGIMSALEKRYRVAAQPLGERVPPAPNGKGH